MQNDASSEEQPASTKDFMGKIVDEFVEEGRLVKIAASILVEKSGQKAIIIGKAGSRLKEVGIAARLELEQAMECKVFLNLHVKIKEACSETGERKARSC